MSTFYKIGEIASLYNISTDILRYYEELGILVPRRAPNGYRIYRTEDLWCLNVIRDLRELGFSMDQIRSYIENRSIGSTLELFQKEMHVIDQQIARLNSLRDNIMNRQWMCGFPDKLVVITMGQFVVSVYGAEDLVDTFRDKLQNCFSSAVVVYDEPIA